MKNIKLKILFFLLKLSKVKIAEITREREREKISLRSVY